MSVSSSVNLGDVFDQDAVKYFGRALKHAISDFNDYGSLQEIGDAESKEAFALAVQNFLRRYHTDYKKDPRGGLPNEEQLVGLMRVVDDTVEKLNSEAKGVKVVRAALVSHALTWYPVGKKENGNKKAGK